MLTPGPIMSGFNIPGVDVHGPLEEKEATIGADVFSKEVPLKMTLASCLVVEFR